MQKPSKKIYLHVGTHKTGTTSLQNFLRDQESYLRMQDVQFYAGEYYPSNHVELHVSAMRDSRPSPVKEILGMNSSEEFREHTRTRIRKFIGGATCNNLIFSAEGLSYLRFEDELDALSHFFDGYEIKVMLYLRDRADFLESYAAQIQRMGFHFSEDNGHFAYVKPDSWLADYNDLIRAYSACFGAEGLIVRDWDAEIKKYGSIIPSFIEMLGIDPPSPEVWHQYWHNRS